MNGAGNLAWQKGAAVACGRAISYGTDPAPQIFFSAKPRAPAAVHWCGHRCGAAAFALGLGLTTAQRWNGQPAGLGNGVANPRRAFGAFERCAAYMRQDWAVALHRAVQPASWERNKLSQIEGVSICGQSFSVSALDFAPGLQGVAKQRVSRRFMARARGLLVRCCLTAIRSPGQLSGSRPISSIARKTPAAARAGSASDTLIRRPFGLAIEIHANAAGEPLARLRRFAFRHTQEQGTANV